MKVTQRELDLLDTANEALEPLEAFAMVLHDLSHSTGADSKTLENVGLVALALTSYARGLIGAVEGRLSGRDESHGL